MWSLCHHHSHCDLTINKHSTHKQSLCHNSGDPTGSTLHGIVVCHHHDSDTTNVKHTIM